MRIGKVLGKRGRNVRTNAECILCLLSRDTDSVPPTVGEAEKTAYLRETMRMVAGSDPSLCTAQLSAKIDELYRKRFGERKLKDYAELKRVYNERMLALEGCLQAVIDASDDPLACAVKLARVGNYIDFGGRHEVDDGLMNELLENVRAEALDEMEYARFKADMAHAGSVAYVADNAGEIVLDKLLIALLLKRFPNAAVTLLVRGGPTLNDATAEDAAVVGLGAIVPVLSNGSSLPGTVRTEISAQARALLTGADVVIAKGQANFETMAGCGLNVYYLLLCKCDFFVRRFGVPRLTGLFVNERRLPFAVCGEPGGAEG